MCIVAMIAYGDPEYIGVLSRSRVVFLYVRFGLQPPDKLAIKGLNIFQNVLPGGCITS